VDDQLQGAEPVPAWPADFTHAMQTVRGAAGPETKSPKAVAARIAAELSILSWAGRQLGWEHLAMPTRGIVVLTPGGSRAADGKMSTSWYAKKGDKLEIEHETSGEIKALWIMNTCLLSDEAKITSLKITGYGLGEQWAVEASLAATTRYFERVSLPGKKARRLTIEILGTRGAGPGCIAEIRLETKQGDDTGP
jgi:hypothetical protein